MKFDKLSVLFIAFILGFGIVWDYLDLFVSLREIGAVWIMSLVNILMFAGSWQNSDKKQGFFIWTLILIVGTFLLEWAGVQTGIIFGDYHYLPKVEPTIYGTPVVIGFAWLGAVLGAHAWTQTIRLILNTLSPFKIALISALLIVAFDLALEPFAIKQEYWAWNHEWVPIQNFIVWAVTGWLFVYTGLRFGVLPKIHNRVAWWGFLIQIVFFITQK